MKNGELKIEKGIPIPQGRHNKGYSEILRKLKVGDSVLLPGQKESVRSLAAKTLGNGKYACRLDKDGVRVWRTK